MPGSFQAPYRHPTPHPPLSHDRLRSHFLSSLDRVGAETGAGGCEMPEGGGLFHMTAQDFGVSVAQETGERERCGGGRSSAAG